TIVWAVMPCLRALNRDWLLPSGVLGPVLLRALRRLASICRGVAMASSTSRDRGVRHRSGRWRRPGPRRRGVAIRQPLLERMGRPIASIVLFPDFFPNSG